MQVYFMIIMIGILGESSLNQLNMESLFKKDINLLPERKIAKYKAWQITGAINTNDLNPPPRNIGLKSFLSTIHFKPYSTTKILKLSIEKYLTLKRNNSPGLPNSEWHDYAKLWYRFSTLKGLLGQAFQEWKGTPYLYGGSSSAGIDCSALVQKLFKEYFDIKMPRTTRQQIKKGKSIAKNDLRAGDLIFFQTSRTRLHVGIVLEEDKFIHASSSEGVTISSLDNDYWMRKYITGRRILSKELFIP